MLLVVVKLFNDTLPEKKRDLVTSMVNFMLQQKKMQELGGPSACVILCRLVILEAVARDERVQSLVSADIFQCLEDETKRVDRLLRSPKVVLRTHVDGDRISKSKGDYFSDYETAEKYECDKVVNKREELEKLALKWFQHLQSVNEEVGSNEEQEQQQEEKEEDEEEVEQENSDEEEESEDNSSLEEEQDDARDEEDDEEDYDEL